MNRFISVTKFNARSWEKQFVYRQHQKYSMAMLHASTLMDHLHRLLRLVSPTCVKPSLENMLQTNIGGCRTHRLLDPPWSYLDNMFPWLTDLPSWPTMCQCLHVLFTMFFNIEVYVCFVAWLLSQMYGKAGPWGCGYIFH